MALRTRRVVRYSFCISGRSVATRKAACSGVTLVLFPLQFGSSLVSLQNSEGHLHYASKGAARARGGVVPLAQRADPSLRPAPAKLRRGRKIAGLRSG